MIGGRKYSVPFTLLAPASATSPVATLTPTAAVRPAIYDITVGSHATPADNAAEFTLYRFTVAPTGAAATVVTPSALDSGDPASLTTAGQGAYATTQPTLGAALLQWAQNQRATFRWVAAPTSELVSAAGTANGLTLLNPAIGGSAVVYDGVIMFIE